MEVAWQVGPVPVDDHVGKEVVLRWVGTYLNMTTSKTRQMYICIANTRRYGSPVENGGRFETDSLGRCHQSLVLQVSYVRAYPCLLTTLLSLFNIDHNWWQADDGEGEGLQVTQQSIWQKVSFKAAFTFTSYWIATISKQQLVQILLVFHCMIATISGQLSRSTKQSPNRRTITRLHQLYSSRSLLPCQIHLRCTIIY